MVMVYLKPIQGMFFFWGGGKKSANLVETHTDLRRTTKLQTVNLVQDQTGEPRGRYSTHKAFCYLFSSVIHYYIENPTHTFGYCSNSSKTVQRNNGPCGVCAQIQHAGFRTKRECL